MAGTLRTRFALLYAGAFGVTGLVVLAAASLTVKSTVHVGSSGPPVVTRPYAHALGPVAVILVVLVAASLGSGWLLADRLLRPVRIITAAARDISATNLSRRLPLDGRENELTRLGRTLNDLFARLEASFQAQRHFVANASHELRTPLTAERTLLQVALADPSADAATLREACEQVLALGTQTERLIDGLLTLATGERGIDCRESVDLADVAARVVQARGGGLTPTLAPAPVAGDLRLAESLVANLADNALTYNVPGGWADIRTGTRDGQAVLSVSNTGPVVPPDEVERLFQPFQRLGGSRVRNAGGHGLGLAIVRAIADAHDAIVTARAREGGGLEIDVIFPAVTQPPPSGSAP
jgi:signal transduction histidine kinase